VAPLDRPGPSSSVDCPRQDDLVENATLLVGSLLVYGISEGIRRDFPPTLESLELLTVTCLEVGS